MSDAHPNHRTNPCATCVHLFTTWRPERPRGCRAFGFECRDWPSNVVVRTSGQPCTQWAARPGAASDPPASGSGDGSGGLYA